MTTWVEPPAGGSPVKVVLDRGRLVNWLINESENTPDYRNVPAMIAELADGDPRPIATEDAAQALSSGIGLLGYGLALGVGCAEWIPYMKGSILSAGRRAFPAYPDSVLALALHVTYLPEECRVWNVPTAPAEQWAATPSTIPIPDALGQLRRHLAGELGAASGADADQLHGPSVRRGRPRRDVRIALRATGVRVVSRHTERTGHGLRRETQAADVRTGAEVSRKIAGRHAARGRTPAKSSAHRRSSLASPDSACPPRTACVPATVSVWMPGPK